MTAADPPAATRLASRAEALAGGLPPLLVAAERVAATVSQGVHGRRRVGQGETFWQFRRYQPGDSVQRIDWRQSAKSDRAYVRETEWEAAQSVWIWCDGSASMRWRSSRERPTKLERADLLALALAALLARGGERFALLGDRAQPSSGRAALQNLATALLRRTEAGSLPLPAQPVPRHARVVLFGDFLAPPAEIEATVAEFARRGVRGHLVRIVDPAEETLPFSGRVLFAGCENDGEALFGRVEVIRAGYRAAFERHGAALLGLARGAGWTMLGHHTDQPPEHALLALYVALAGPTRW